MKLYLRQRQTMDLHKIKASSGPAIGCVVQANKFGCLITSKLSSSYLEIICKKEIAASLIGLQDKLNKVWKEAANLVCLHDTP